MFRGKSIEDWENYVSLHITEYDFDDSRRIIESDETPLIEKLKAEIGVGYVVEVIRQADEIRKPCSKIIADIYKLLGSVKAEFGYTIEKTAQDYRKLTLVIRRDDIFKLFHYFLVEEIPYSFEFIDEDNII